MRNLAGVDAEDATAEVLNELRSAKITPVAVLGDRGGEVAALFDGYVVAHGETITFRRAWRYWVASGPVPLEVAAKVYADPCARDIRAGGHANGGRPADHLTRRTADGRVVVDRPDPDTMRMLDRMTPDWRDRYAFMGEADVASRTVDVYHIDSVVGLRVFVDKLTATP